MIDETPAPEPAAAPETLPPKPPEMSPAACGAKLAELFPALFAGPPRPIKLRIQADLQERAPGVFTKRVLGLFLSRHTTTTAYLKALLASPTRFDLDGQPAGEISAEHRAAAEAELARRREIHDARRAAERAAARAAQPAPAADPPNRPERPQPPGQRPPRPERPAGAQRPPRPPRPSRPEARRAPPMPARPPRDPAPPPMPPREPQDPAQRERALLLRQFESSPLTKANFCALKRISEAELDAQLALARSERQPPKPPKPPGPAAHK